MYTSREIFESKRHIFKPVPPEGLPSVCYLCLGAVDSTFPQCYPCRKLFQEGPCPASMERRVVPMTIALNPSTWYHALQNYKTAQFREYGSTLGSLAYRWLNRHHDRLANILGGEPDYVTVVPSKKGVTTFETQPLRKALATVTPMRERLREVLRCASPMMERLREYRPDIFAPVADVSGHRVILVEDTWITGATALSAAGALLDAGAESVVITPIARDMKPTFHGEEHPYLRYIRHEYDLEAWPR